MMVQESLHMNSERKLEEIRSESCKDAFNELVLAGVDECLSSIGESIKQSTYLYLKEHYNISMEEIPLRIGDFAEALEESFGVGGKLVEIEIMKKLYEKTGPFLYFPHGKNLSFEDYVETLRYFL